ncbi:hypothetical protein GUK21_14925 [Rhizobium leguminosarum]|nr:hypothetical protein [Rhizobium ruizarguesonis]NEJ64916.1 hypothetical protein [Rhizobium ruizarguesonis]
MSSRFKRKGKSKFVMIDGYIMRSAAWDALTPVDRAAYLFFKWKFDGLNNGRLALGCRELAAGIHVSKNTANRSLDNLEGKGFIARTKLSGFNIKNRVATEWRLTEYPCGVTGELATKEFMKWVPHEKSTVPPEGRTVPPEGQKRPQRKAKYG